MHDRTHICAAVMGRERDKLSSAALVPPSSLLINSAGIQCSFFLNYFFKRVQHSLTLILYCMCALSA